MAWRNYTCTVSEKPALVLIDEGFNKRFPVPELPLLSWFGVYCKLPPGASYWSPDETAALDKIEEQLISLAGKFGHGWAVYVLRIATTGLREYYMYHGADAEMDKVYSCLQMTASDYRIEFETTDDKEWEQYKRYSSYRSTRGLANLFGWLK